MFSRTPLFVTALALVTACQANGPVFGQTSDIRPTREPVLADEVTLEVVTKRAPDALVSRDGSLCRVSPDVYASTRAGSVFRCRWLRS